MSRLVAAGPADKLAAGSSLVVDTPAEQVAVFNIDGEYFACSNRCPHAGGPLSDGFVRDTSVVCPWHGWNFDLSIPGDDAMDGVTRYKVLTKDGNLFVELP